MKTAQDKIRRRGSTYLLTISTAVALGGFLFGFDTAVISGAISMLKKQLQLTPMMEGWVMSSALVGCIIGAGLSGWLADRYGKKKNPLCLGSAVRNIRYDLRRGGNAFYAGCRKNHRRNRVGFAAMVAPMYISEVSVPATRGRMVSLYQLAITLGILGSYLSNRFLLRYASAPVHAKHSWLDYYFIQEPWRAMLGSNMVPALLFLVFLFFVPESPRWLLMGKKERDAFKILERINGPELARQSLKEITGTLKQESGKWSQLFDRSMSRVLLVGLLLPLFQQLTAITAVMYYAPAIFESAGIHTEAAMSSAVIIGLINTLFTIVAIWKIDRWGRRPLLMYGFLGLCFSLVLIGSAFLLHNTSGEILASFFILYIAVFAATIGPGVWVIISEIFSYANQGKSHVSRNAFPVCRFSHHYANLSLAQGFIWRWQDLHLIRPADDSRRLVCKKVYPGNKG